MPIEFVKRYSREEIRANRRKIYIFGDNMQQRGLGGQAGAARFEPNTIGVPTKWRPGRGRADYFSDADLFEVMPSITHSFRRMRDILRAGETIVWPEDGVGSGRAELKQRAPMIAEFIQLCIRALQKEFGS